MSLRPAPRRKLGAPAHRRELVRPERAVRARIDRQTRDGAPWEICLEYLTKPGSRHLGWFVADTDNLRPASDDDQ